MMTNLLVSVAVSLALFCAYSDCRMVLDSKTCQFVENPITFTIYRLDCTYQGPGLYEFLGPDTIKIVTMDRLTEDSHFRTHEQLQEIKIYHGTVQQCRYITAPASVKITIGGELCVCIFH